MLKQILTTTTALFFGAVLAFAQEPPKPEAKPLDRGDDKAEKALKRAYTRIASAESKGLSRLYADAKVSFDMTKAAIPRNVPPCEGKLMWKSGTAPLLELQDPREGWRISPLAEDAFKHYTPYIFGMPAWDGHFAKAHFSFADAPKDLPEEAAKDRFILVKFANETLGSRTYQVRDLLLISISFETTIAGNSATVRLGFTFDDRGKELRLTQIDADATAMVMVEPAQGEEGDDGNPAGPKPVKTSVQQTVRLSEYATAGKAEICSKMTADISIELRDFKLEFPATLELTKIRADKDVTDADLKPLLALEQAGPKDKPKPSPETPKDPEERDT